MDSEYLRQNFDTNKIPFFGGKLFFYLRIRLVEYTIRHSLY